MRRIGRWMLNAVTAMSLLLCVGTVVVGITWTSGPEGGGWQSTVNDFQIWEIQTIPLGDRSVAGFPDYTYGAFGFVNHADHGPPVAIRDKLGVPAVYTHMVEIPLWPFALLLVLVALRIATWVAAKRDASRESGMKIAEAK